MHKYRKHIKELGSGHNIPAPENIIADLVLEKFADCTNVLVAVGGPGGTGKSSFCKRLSALLDDSNILHLDDYKTARELRHGKNVFGAHPEANMMDMVQEHYMSAKDGEDFHKPVYNAVSGEADSTEFYSTKRFTIIDGEISTYKQFRDHIDFAVFIDSELETQLNTRLTRDINERKYSYEKAIATFFHSNLREFSEFGAESKNWADIHLHCRKDYRLVFDAVAEEHIELFRALTSKEFTGIEYSESFFEGEDDFSVKMDIDYRRIINHLSYTAETGGEIDMDRLQQAVKI